jgi:hypothetical protein
MTIGSGFEVAMVMGALLLSGPPGAVLRGLLTVLTGGGLRAEPRGVRVGGHGGAIG